MSNKLADSAAASWPPTGARASNLEAIVERLRQHGPATRSELIEHSGLSKATVSGLVSELLEHGFTTEAGKLPAARGRRRDLLTFNPAVRSVLGAQVDDTSCAVVRTDLHGRVQERAVRSIDGSDPQLVLDAVAQTVAGLRDRHPVPVLGLGIGVPGDVDRAGRTVRVAVSHGWTDLAVADELETRLRLPVVAANRAKVAALGQLRQPHRPAADNLVYVFLGRGLVAGIVIDGRLYFGRTGGAGDIGHVTVRPDGALCGCGNHGCLHTVAGESAILAGVRAAAREPGVAAGLAELARGPLSTARVARAVEQADPDLLRVLGEVGYQVGLVVANLSTTLAPDVVVLGGPTTRLGEPLLEPIRRTVHRRCLPESRPAVEVADAADDLAGAAGAAALFISGLTSVLRRAS